MADPIQYIILIGIMAFSLWCIFQPQGPEETWLDSLKALPRVLWEVFGIVVIAYLLV